MNVTTFKSFKSAASYKPKGTNRIFNSEKKLNALIF